MHTHKQKKHKANEESLVDPNLGLTINDEDELERSR